MTLFYDVVQADNVGTTISTKETIGTITMNNVARRIVAMIIQDVESGVSTTAEATLGTVHVSSSDAGFTNFQTGTNLCKQGTSATNSGGKQTKSLVIPLDIPIAPKAEVTFEYQVSAPEPTADVACQVFLVYTDGNVPADIIQALWQGYMPYPVRQSKVANDDELGDITQENYDDSITFEGKYTEIIGYRANLLNDALATDDEHQLGYVDLSQGGTLLDLNPMKLPLPAVGSELGAQVDNPIRWSEEFPLYINKGAGKETIQPQANLQATTTGALASNVTLYAR